MKKFRLLFLIIAAMLAGTQNGVAQTWAGHTPGSLVGAEGQDAEVYLWNVGTGQFLYVGGNWGTQAITYDTGTQFTITNQGHGTWWGGTYYTYTLQSHLTHGTQTSGYLTLTDGSGRTSVHDSGTWFVDLNVSDTDFRNLYFTSAGGNNYYYINVGISRNSGVFSNEEVFGRNNDDISHWHTGDVSSANEQSTSLTTDYADITFGSYENGMLAPTSPDVPQYYVGNGYDKNDDSDNGYYDNSTESMKDGESHQKLYGNYWTANIKGDGAIWQKVRVTVDYPGWYIISCDGLTTKTQGTVELFASTYSDANMTNLLNTRTSEFTTVTAADGAPETYTEAGQLLYTNETYQKQVMIYVDDSKPYLVLGVRANGVNSDAWTCVDNFQIQYAGNSESEIVLDENQTGIDYINVQVDNTKSYTLRLGRKLINNAWNSIMLPVNLTRQQLQLAFGNNVKLSEKNPEASEDPYIIEFTSIDISNKPEEEVVLKAGVPYIIKPSRLLTTTPKEGGDTYEVRKRADNTVYTNITLTEPYYTINQVTLDTEVEAATVTGNGGNAYDCGNAGDVYFKGTYTQQNYLIPAGSYLLSNGQWNYMTVGVNSVKGFRTWLESETGTNANVVFSVDGVVDGGETNAIEGVVTDSKANADNKVYNMNGQVVRNNSASLEGLPKGVYIVNNKKYIVK